MALPVYLQDPSTGARMAVTRDGLLLATLVQGSASDVSNETLTRQKQLRVFLARASGETDLNVNGATAPVTFSIASVPGRIRWITQLRFLFNGNNMEMGTQDFRRFGAATSVGAALTNGVTAQAVQGGIVTELFAPNVTRMGDFFNYSDAYTNIANSISAQADFLSFDVRFPVPIVLPPGATDSLTVTIQDNLTALDLFKVLATGYQEIL